MDLLLWLLLSPGFPPEEPDALRKPATAAANEDREPVSAVDAPVLEEEPPGSG